VRTKSNAERGGWKLRVSRSFIHEAFSRTQPFPRIDRDFRPPVRRCFSCARCSAYVLPSAILQPRAAVAFQIAPKTVRRSGFGLFSDLLPGSVVDLVGVNPPYSETFQGVSWAQLEER